MLWIKDPAGIFGADCERGIVVDGGVIVECVAKGREPSVAVSQVFDASAHAVLPGLINTHHHFYQTLTRAFGPAQDKELFDWLKTLYPVWSRLNPDWLRLAVRLALAETLLSGATTIADHHYVFPDGLEDAIDIEVEEARALGVRAVLTRGSMNLSVADGGLPPASVVQDEETILLDSERLIGRYHEPDPLGMTQIALAPCSPFSVSGTLMRETAQMAERFDVRLHTHLAETEDENAFCVEKFGCRPVDYLEECGWLGSRTWVAHGIFFNDDEVVRLGKAGVGVAHCPTANMILGSGLCRAADLDAAGSPVGIGVDGSAAQDCSNLIQEVRQAFLLGRIKSGVSKVSHRDVLRWATEGSAACIGRSNLGKLAPGYAADLALFKLDEMRFSGHGDAIVALINSGAHHADRVMVKGNWVVEDGAIVGLDTEALVREHQQAARQIQALA